MRGLNGGNVEFRTIPVVGPALIGGADVLRVDPAQVRQFVDQLTLDSGADGTAGVASTTSAPPPTRTGSAKRPKTTATTTPATTISRIAAITAGSIPCVN
jgi:hypothetical protein